MSTVHLHRKAPAAFVVGILFAGVLPLVADSAAAFSTLCSEDSYNWSFEAGYGGDGFVLKDVKFGASGGTKEYRIKYANSNWVDVDMSVGGVVYLSGAGAFGTPVCSYTASIGVAKQMTVTFDPTTGNEDGWAGTTVVIRVQWDPGGYFEVQETSTVGDTDRQHELGINVDCSDTGSADPSDDGIRFNHTWTTGPAAQVRYESDMFGDGPGTNGADFEAVDVALDNRLCLSEDANEPTNDYTFGYAMLCTACTAESSNTQYTDGPWDFLNTEGTWNADVMLAVAKQTQSATSGSNNWQTQFQMFAYDL